MHCAIIYIDYLSRNKHISIAYAIGIDSFDKQILANWFLKQYFLFFLSLLNVYDTVLYRILAQ